MYNPNLKQQHKAWAIALGLSLLASSTIPAFATLHHSHGTAMVHTGATYTRQYKDTDSVLQTGQYQAAETKYTAQLKANSKNAAARANLSMAQAELYKLDAAEKSADDVLGKNPKPQAAAVAHMAKGVVYRNRTASLDMTYRGDRENLMQKSATELQQAASLNPNSPEIHNQLGVTYRFMGRNPEAQAEFEKAMELDPRYAEARLNEGVMMMANGNISGAKEMFNQAIKMNSKNFMAHYRLGEALLAGGDAHGALTSLNTALSLNQGNAAIMTKQGDAYQQQGNTAAAIASYHKAIQANAAFMPAYTAISDIYDNRGDGEMAMAELRSAINVNPNWGPGLNKLGRLALTVDKPDQALQYYRESMKRNPQDAEAINGISQALTVVAQKQANWSQTVGADSDLMNAEASIQEALRMNPNDMRLHLANLRISQLAGKPAMSEQELETLSHMTPHNDSEAMMQSEAFIALGRYQDADQSISHVLQSASGDTDKLLVIGDTLKVNGDLLRAKDAYQMALASDPNNQKARRGIDRINTAQAEADKTLRTAQAFNTWRRSGKEASIDYLEDALSKNPRQPDARLELSKLYEKTGQSGKAARSYQYYVGLRPDLTEKDRQSYEKRIARLQQDAAEEAARPADTRNQQPLPSTMQPLSPASAQPMQLKTSERQGQ